MIRRIQLAPIVIALGLVSGSAHAALQGRDLNGSPGSFEAYYDTDRNITWLANANVNGRMNWAEANTWAASLSFTDGVGLYNNWRLPTVVDTGTPGCDFAFTGTDCGYNADTATSEMAHLFYDELGNKAYFDTSGGYPQSGWGLFNTGPFTNLRAYAYWSGTEEPGTSSAWFFDFTNGNQSTSLKPNGFLALAVSPGDVGAVPEADTWAMLLAGLALVGAATRWRRG